MSQTEIIELKDQLNEWAGSQISIRKEENGDLDQINIQLDKATFEQRDAQDDYLGDHILFIHGKAYSMESEKPVKLPTVLYEIPIDGIEGIQLDSDLVTFKTQRGTYAINKMG